MKHIFDVFLYNHFKCYLILVFGAVCFLPNCGYSQRTILNKNWSFRQVGTEFWKSAEVPGTIHTDLMKHFLIQDPFYGDNESKSQWVSKQDWEYKTYFELNTLIKPQNPIYLKFNGLDTYADVYLNGIRILQANNMFRTYLCEVSGWLSKEDNELKIIFHAAERIADSIANINLPMVRPCENNRHYLRKAQYHFGWDWAPKLITCGIWRDIELICGNEAVGRVDSSINYSQIKFKQEQDSIGSSFYFSLNENPIYMKGANWVPADVFLPRVSKSKYRQLLIAAKEANINMLRVWGGGIYEDDYFYTLCDSLEINIWQDFMFAGAMYPADSSSLENIKAEAIDNIIRLRKHKCIVLWCGNNEINEAWHNWGWQKQFAINSDDSLKLWNEYKDIFETLLPSLVHEFDSGRAYIPSSPLYGWGRDESMQFGDSHYWGLWWGDKPLNVLNEKIPRFMSEFGMQAMPGLKSIEQFASKVDWDTSSNVMKIHQKNSSGYNKLNTYLQLENLNPKNFYEFVEATQELQSRVIQTGLKAQIQSNGRCMGSLWWQFNDCWPVCSWSLIDYYGRKKKGYSTMKKVYAEKLIASPKR